MDLIEAMVLHGWTVSFTAVDDGRIYTKGVHADWGTVFAKGVGTIGPTRRITHAAVLVDPQLAALFALAQR